MKRLSVILLSILVIIAAMLIVPHETQAQQTRQIILGGHKFDPPVRTSGSGTVTVELKNDTLRVSGEFSDLTNNFSGAYIMLMMKRGPGNLLYRLKVNLNEDKTSGTFEAKENTFVLSKAQKELLKNGELYITIASFDHRRGEIMGMIPPMG
jgi:hypothetical protein